MQLDVKAIQSSSLPQKDKPLGSKFLKKEDVLDVAELIREV